MKCKPLDLISLQEAKQPYFSDRKHSVLNKHTSLFCVLLLFSFTRLSAQIPDKTQNIFVITLDGFRWQEVFGGADRQLIGDPQYVQDSSITRELFWDEDVFTRRAKLLPFFWSTIAQKGQLFGNRVLGNKFNVKNRYKISYPGYNEILTGYTDPGILLNLYKNDRNTNILEFLNNKKEFTGKVVAFSSWNVFPKIINSQRSRFPVNSGYDSLTGEQEDTTFNLINEVSRDVAHQSNTRYDWLTFLSAREYIEEHQPRIVFIGFGETDEFAHKGRYDLYLQKASDIDKMIADLWYYVQTHPFYKNKTTFIITTDHGRGSKSFNWSNHSFLTARSGETWLAMIGPGVAGLGELKSCGQGYQKQLASTIAGLLDERFSSIHHIGKPLVLAAVPVIQNGMFQEQGIVIQRIK